MSLPRFPRYRATGLEWLPQVPAHWDLKPLKRACRVLPSNVDKKVYDGEEAVRLCNYTDVYYNDAITADMDLMSASATPEQIAKFTLRAGDTVITKDSETADDIAVSAYVPRDLPGVLCGYHLAIVRPRQGVSGAFIKRLFDSTYLRSSVEVRANGLTRVGLSQDALDSLQTPLPPLNEQVDIVRFLERETAFIDALVSEQRRLIKLLNEKRQALISQAVTKGLNPGAPMKASGVGWLGDVPAHWDVTRCGRHLAILSGFAFPSAGFTLDSSETRLLRGVNVGVQSLRWEDAVYWRREPDDSLDCYELRVGDVVLGMDRPVIAGGVRVAKLAFEDVPSLLLQRVACLRPSDRINADYLIALLASPMFVAHFAPETTGVSVPHISPDQIGSFVIPLPPREEQDEIVAKLSRATNKAKALMNDAECAIELLQERRTALISAAVTGQIDMRGLVGSGDLGAEATNEGAVAAGVV